MSKAEAVPQEWIDYCNSGLKPENIPDRPDIVYRDCTPGWLGWDHWLGMHRQDQEINKEHELAVWVEEQKVAYRLGELSEEQITKLEELPGWTWEIETDDDETK